MAETLFTDILTRLRPGYNNGGEVKKRGPKGKQKGSAISKFSEFLRKLSPEKIAATNINDLITLSEVDISKTNALNALAKPEFSSRSRREMTKTDKANLKKLLEGKEGRLSEEKVTYKGKEYYKGSDGRIRVVRQKTLEEKVKQSQNRRNKSFGGIGKSGTTNPKMNFWESLIDSNLKAVRPKQDGSRSINVSRLNPTNVNLKEILIKGGKLSQSQKRKIKFKDSVTGKTFGFKDLESYMENNIGKGSYKKVIDDLKTKTFLNTTYAQVDGKPLSLRYILNETLIPGWTKTNKMQNTFQIHHPFGFSKNPFVTQLSFFDDNKKEYIQRSNFFKKLKNEKTLSGKKKLVTNFAKGLPPGILSAPGKKIYGQAFSITDILNVAADRAEKTGNKNIKKIFESEQFKKDFKSVFGTPADKSLPQVSKTIKNPIKFMSTYGIPDIETMRAFFPSVNITDVDYSNMQLGTGKLAKAAGVAKNVAKIGGKALGLAAIPLEVANMLNMRKQGKTTAEILGSPFFLSGRIGEAQDLMKMTPLERQAVSEQQIAGDESMLDTDFYTPRQEGIEAVDIEAVQERVRKQREAEEQQRALERSKGSGFTYPNMYGINSVKGVI
jgi:hypothetical protein